MIRNEVDGTSVCLHHFPSKQSISSEKGDPIMASFLLRAVKSQTAARVIRRGWGGIPRESRVYLPVAEQSSGSVAYRTKLCPPPKKNYHCFSISAVWSLVVFSSYPTLEWHTCLNLRLYSGCDWIKNAPDAWLRRASSWYMDTHSALSETASHSVWLLWFLCSVCFALPFVFHLQTFSV